MSSPDSPFSSRTGWNLRPNSLSRLLAAKRRVGEQVLDLTESNPTRVGLNYPSQQILDALRTPENLIYDPQPAGLRVARESVARYYASRGAHISPKHVLLTSSTSEAYSYLFKLLADPGDEVLAPNPSYPLFEYLARLEAVSLVHYPLRYQHGWWLDLEALHAAVTPRTRAILAVSPNNPTGSYLKVHEMEGLAKLCQEREIALVCDEVFADYTLTPAFERAGTAVLIDNALVFTVSGLSKIVGLPQMKVGWIVTAGPQSLRRSAMERLELIADTYLSVATPAQHAAGRWLDLRAQFQRELLRRSRGNLAFLRGAAEEAVCEVLDVEGGWYSIIRLPITRTDEEWSLALLEEANVLIQPGFFYDFPAGAYAVVSLLTEPEQFQKGVERLLRFVSES